jgi:hypothetical protein
MYHQNMLASRTGAYPDGGISRRDHAWDTRWMVKISVGRWAAVLGAAVLLVACGGSTAAVSGGAPGTADVTASEDGAADPTTSLEATPGGADGFDQTGDIATLAPASSFTVDGVADAGSAVLSPDGSKVAISTQATYGTAPVTIAVFDASTGESLGSIEADIAAPGILRWMADDRLVMIDKAGLEPTWYAWDGATLESSGSVPGVLGCEDGRPDVVTGAVYSTNGLTGMGDVICRFDTGDGSRVLSADGLLVDPQAFWVDSGSDQVLVLHEPNPEAAELLTLDGSTLTKSTSMVIEFSQTVDAVGSTIWITDTDNAGGRTSHLEPAGIAVPSSLDPLATSVGGTVFLTRSDTDQVVFVSATDGAVIGSIPSGLNPVQFSGWSVDDQVFMRLTQDGIVEIYRLG